MYFYRAVLCVYCAVTSYFCLPPPSSGAGEMQVYVGGQQPGQMTDVGSNVLQTKFVVKM